MDKEIKLEFKNYKLFQDRTFNLEAFNVYLVSGINDSGKTSLITSLQEMYGIFALTNDPVTTGSTEGSKTFTIPDKEGNMVTVKHTYDRSKAKGKFVAFDKDGTPYRQVGEIRELLGSYSRITTEQFFDKAKTAPGRKEIVNEYFVQFLTDTEISSLNKLKDLEIVNYDMRTDAKKEVDLVEKRMGDYKPTAGDEEMIEKKVNSDKLLKQLKHDRNDIALLDKNLEILNERGDSLQEKLDTLEFNYAELIDDKKVDLGEMKEEEKGLERKLKKLQEEIAETEKFLATPDEDHKNKVDGIRKLIIENDKEVDNAKEKAGNPDMTLEALDERITKGDKLMNDIAICESRTGTYNEAKKDYEEALKEWEGLDQKVEESRAKIKQIYASSSLPSGVQIEDDTFTLNGFEFSETQISESKAKLVIAEIMCQVDTAPLLVMGNAAAFGKERLNELCSLAEKHNKIMFLEKVVDDIEDVRVVGVVYNKELSENKPEKLF